MTKAVFRRQSDDRGDATPCDYSSPTTTKSSALRWLRRYVPQATR